MVILVTMLKSSQGGDITTNRDICVQSSAMLNAARATALSLAFPSSALVPGVGVSNNSFEVAAGRDLDNVEVETPVSISFI
jgi:ABC-type proline/glycine betaine transport system ATPase subunit